MIRIEYSTEFANAKPIAVGAALRIAVFSQMMGEIDRGAMQHLSGLSRGGFAANEEEIVQVLAVIQSMQAQAA